MKRFCAVLAALGFLGVSIAASADHRHDHDQTSSGTYEVLVKVNGIVCSFCAQGVEKSLGKLEGLDRTKYGNGVLVEIEEQRVVIAFLEGTPVPEEEIRKRIREAGYDPVQIERGTSP